MLLSTTVISCVIPESSKSACRFLSISARKEAFVKNVPFYYYQNRDIEYKMIPEDFAEQFVQLFGTAKIDGSLSKLSRIQFKAKNNKVSPEILLEVTDDIIRK